MAARPEPVSIIVPAFNEVGIIGQVLDTIIHQTSANGAQYELIVVDDGSSIAHREDVSRRERQRPPLIGAV